MTLAMNAKDDCIAAGAGQGDGGLGYLRVHENTSAGPTGGGCFCSFSTDRDSRQITFYYEHDK